MVKSLKNNKDKIICILNNNKQLLFILLNFDKRIIDSKYNIENFWREHIRNRTLNIALYRTSELSKTWLLKK